MQSLRPGSLLQGGKYKIERTLGQGGFGITYLAVQDILDRKVAIKEFFMKEYCDREADTSRVSVPSEGGRKQVDRFRSKFIREARMIASLDNPHIVRIHDVFEENGTAYYVMDYLPGGSLKEKTLTHDTLAICAYISQLCSALGYLHAQNILHLDVKPSNILFDKAGNAVLVDFGISKHYDEEGGQTSSTPIGISKGYAPLEQYQQGDMVRFTPATDIYSLGATLYYLVTGCVPPDASIVNEDGLPELSPSVPANIRNAILAAMQPRRKDRPQSVKKFLDILNAQDKVGKSDDDEVTITSTTKLKTAPSPRRATAHTSPSRLPSHRFLWICAAAVLGLFLTLILWQMWPGADNDSDESGQSQSQVVTKVEENTDSSQTFTVGDVSFKMISVEGGTFQMGTTSGDGDEQPVHSVTLSSFSIGETEVTQELWQAVMGSNPSHSKGNKLPVERVSWNDCQTFITKLNQLTGKTFRLPTEAEWEYAARGGNKSKGYTYSGSNTIGDVAWYTSNCSSTTHAVATKAPNELGIYDMSGNVWEWCNDWYGSYSSGSLTNPTGPASGSDRVERGGSWVLSAAYCRVANRIYNSPTSTSSGLGLRLAL